MWSKPGSMLLGTTRPAELRAWYIKALAPEFTGEGAIIKWKHA
ncbi:hypothetical protein [Actinomadura sp. 6N118]